MTVALVFALGVLVGLLIGIAVDDALDMLKKEHFKMPFSTPAHRVMSGALAVAVVLILIVGVLLLRTRASANDYYACMADWQQQSAAAQITRASANEDVQKAMDRIVFAVVSQDRTAIQEALKSYVSLRAKQDAERKAHPYPDPPKEVCGDAGETRR